LERLTTGSCRSWRALGSNPARLSLPSLRGRRWPSITLRVVTVMSDLIETMAASVAREHGHDPASWSSPLRSHCRSLAAQMLEAERDDVPTGDRVRLGDVIIRFTDMLARWPKPGAEDDWSRLDDAEAGALNALVSKLRGIAPDAPIDCTEDQRRILEQDRALQREQREERDRLRADNLRLERELHAALIELGRAIGKARDGVPPCEV